MKHSNLYEDSESGDKTSRKFIPNLNC